MKADLIVICMQCKAIQDRVFNLVRSGAYSERPIRHMDKRLIETHTVELSKSNFLIQLLEFLSNKFSDPHDNEQPANKQNPC